MKVPFSLVPVVGAILLALNGCSKRTNTQSGISQLKQAFPTASAAAPAASDSPVETAGKQVNVNAYVGQAMVLLQKNDHVGAVTLLTTVRRQRNLTAEQHMAVHETIAKVCADLANRVAQGDAEAKAEMAELLKKLSQ